MNLNPFRGARRYPYIHWEMEMAVRRMWRRPDSKLNQFAPDVEKVLHQLNQQARDERRSG